MGNGVATENAVIHVNDADILFDGNALLICDGDAAANHVMWQPDQISSIIHAEFFFFGFIFFSFQFSPDRDGWMLANFDMIIFLWTDILS